MNLPLFIARRTAQPTAENRPGVMVRFATIAVALSLAVMLLAMAVILGFKAEISHRLIGFTAEVELTDIRTRADQQGPGILPSNQLYELITRHPQVVGMTPYVSKGAILKSSEAMQGVVLKGVDQTYDTRFFEGLICEGSMPSVGDSLRKKEVLLSLSVARKLRLEVGQKVELIFIEKQGGLRRDRFKISGFYHSGMEEADMRYLLTDMRNLQRLNDWQQGEVSGYEIRLTNHDIAPQVASELNHALLYAEEEGFENLICSSVQEHYPTMFDWLRTHDVNAAVILGIMLLVALFNLTSALLILVLERTRMIGLLKALGMGNREIQQLFLYRALFITLKGVAWGNLIALGLSLIQKWGHVVKLDASGYLLSEVPIALNWGWWLIINLGTITAILFLLIVPTSIVSRIQPEKSIKYE